MRKLSAMSASTIESIRTIALRLRSSLCDHRPSGCLSSVSMHIILTDRPGGTGSGGGEMG